MEHTAYQHVRVLTLVLAIIKIKYFLNDDLSLNTCLSYLKTSLGRLCSGLFFSGQLIMMSFY